MPIAKHLAVLKSFAGSEQDWSDIGGIVDCNPDLDRIAIVTQLSGLTALLPDNDTAAKLTKHFTT